MSLWIYAVLYPCHSAYEKKFQRANTKKWLMRAIYVKVNIGSENWCGINKYCDFWTIHHQADIQCCMNDIQLNKLYGVSASVKRSLLTIFSYREGEIEQRIKIGDREGGKAVWLTHCADWLIVSNIIQCNICSENRFEYRNDINCIYRLCSIFCGCCCPSYARRDTRKKWTAVTVAEAHTTKKKEPITQQIVALMLEAQSNKKKTIGLLPTLRWENFRSLYNTNNAAMRIFCYWMLTDSPTAAKI